VQSEQNIKMEIVIKFKDETYGILEKDKYESIRNACWVVNCALSAIQRSYKENAPRLIEMEKLATDLMLQIRAQISDEAYEENYKFFRPFIDEFEEFERISKLRKQQESTTV